MRNRLIAHEENLLKQEQTFSSTMPELALFILTALIIIFFGLVVLYSTSFITVGPGLFKKQLTWMIVGLIAFFGVIFFGYKNLADLSPLMVLGIMALLVSCLFFKEVKGARRWIHLGAFNIQPSEYAKVILVLFESWFLSKRIREIEDSPFWKVMVPAGISCGMMIGLVLLGKDLGTTALLTVVFFSLLFVAGVPWYMIFPIIVVMPIVTFLYIKEFDAERMTRLTTFVNPEIVQAGDGYQLWNSLLALGSGSWFGVGFTESRLKLKYLPEAHTDFILAIVGEELGLIAIFAVILAYIVLAIAGLRISSHARTRLGMYVAFGMVCFMSIQAIINIGVICGGFPTKGMPAPMISYGGSNLVACMTALGFVASVALDNSYPDYQENLWKKAKNPGRFFGIFSRPENDRNEEEKP